MGFLRALLRFYSYVFHGLFALFLLAISVIALTSGSTTLRLHILPWEGRTLAYAMLGLAVAGILVVFMAMKGVARSLFFLWSLLVLVLVLRGYFFSSYSFAPGTGQMTTALWVILAAAIAAVGARMRPRSAA